MNKKDKNTDARDIKMIMKEHYDQIFMNIFESLDAMDKLIPRKKYNLSKQIQEIQNINCHISNKSCKLNY